MINDNTLNFIRFSSGFNNLKKEELEAFAFAGVDPRWADVTCRRATTGAWRCGVLVDDLRDLVSDLKRLEESIGGIE